VRAAVERSRASGRAVPFALVAIGGTAATGKTTLARRLAAEAGVEASVLETDGYMMERPLRRALGITGPNPRANDVARLAKDLAAIARGERVEALARVETEAGRKSLPVPFEPKPLVIVEGLIALYPEANAAGARFDLSFFLDGPPEDELAVRRVRDVQERQHPAAEVEEVFWLRQREYDLYLRPTAARADLRLWAARSAGAYVLSIVE
jgi:uridine kinase